MSDSRSLVYESDGTFHEGGVKPMDVAAGAHMQAAPVPTKPKSIGLDDAPKPAPKKQAFNMSELRKAAMKSATTVERTTLPDKGAVSLGNVDVVQSGVTEPEPAAKNEPQVKPEAKHDVPRVETEEPKVATPRQEEPKVAEGGPQTEQPVSGDSTPDVVEEQRVEPAVTEAKPAVHEMKLGAVEHSGTASSAESAEKSVEEKKSAPAEAPAIADTAQVSDEGSVTVQAKKTEVTNDEAGFSGNGFQLVGFEEFLGICKSERAQFVKWCKKCLAAATTSPATIFTSGWNDKLRFYNYSFHGKQICAVVGCGDSVTCISSDFRRTECMDSTTAVSCDGQSVKFKDGSVAALYSERLRKPRVV